MSGDGMAASDLARLRAMVRQALESAEALEAECRALASDEGVGTEERDWLDVFARILGTIAVRNLRMADEQLAGWSR